jgi:hypothetical protein
MYCYVTASFTELLAKREYLAESQETHTFFAAHLGPNLLPPLSKSHHFAYISLSLSSLGEAGTVYNIYVFMGVDPLASSKIKYFLWLALLTIQQDWHTVQRYRIDYCNKTIQYVKFEL